MAPCLAGFVVSGLHEAAWLAPEGTVRPIDDEAADEAKSLSEVDLGQVTLCQVIAGTAAENNWAMVRQGRRFRPS